MAGVCGSVPVYGRNVGRAISPAAGPCGIAGFAGRCKHRPLRSTGQGPARFYRIFPSQTSPAGVNARPTMQGKRAAGPGTAGGVPALGSFPRWPATPPCVGADACIGPPAGLTDGWRLCVTARSRRLCRAGDFARRRGLAASQGFAGRCKHRPLRSIGRSPAGFGGCLRGRERQGFRAA